MIVTVAVARVSKRRGLPPETVEAEGGSWGIVEVVVVAVVVAVVVVKAEEFRETERES